MSVSFGGSPKSHIGVTEKMAAEILQLLGKLTPEMQKGARNGKFESLLLLEMPGFLAQVNESLFRSQVLQLQQILQHRVDKRKEYDDAVADAKQRGDVLPSRRANHATANQKAVFRSVLTYLRKGTTFAATVAAGLSLEEANKKLTQELVAVKAELEMTRDLAAPMLLLGSSHDSQLPEVMSHYVEDDVGSSSQPPWPIQ